MLVLWIRVRNGLGRFDGDGDGFRESQCMSRYFWLLDTIDTLCASISRLDIRVLILLVVGVLILAKLLKVREADVAI